MKKKRNPIPIIILIACIAAFIYNVGRGDIEIPGLSQSVRGFATENLGISYDGETSTIEYDDGRVEDKSSIYIDIYKQLADYKTTVVIKTNTDDINYIEQEFSDVVTEHPELFWITGNASLEGNYLLGVYEFTIVAEVEGDITDMPSMYQDAMAQVDAIVAQANTRSTDRDKIRYVHDELIKRCDYDTEAAKKVQSANSREGTNYACTVYGALVNRKAVCEGYAKSFQIIMNRLNIPCKYITGTATNNLGTGNHAWNAVLIDDRDLYIDCTWDDPVGARVGYVGYDYYLIPASKMALDHTEKDLVHSDIVEE